MPEESWTWGRWWQSPRELDEEGVPEEFAFAPFFNAQSSEPQASSGEFTSIPELVAQLETTDLHQVAHQMRKFRAELWRSTRAVYAAAASELAERARDITERKQRGL
eukprot:s1386_g1.t1